MTAPPDDTTTGLHAVIATLRAERDAALARETKRDGDYVERAAHQGATVEVLQAMAVSPDDPKPVFELIVRRAHDLCDAYTASLARVVDGSIVLGAYVVPDEGDAEGHEASFPRPVAADTMFGRAILAREPVQLPDVAADQTYALREGTLRGAVRAQAAVPLMRDGEAVGAINITRRQTGEFSHVQIELLQVFANQAVIAITSAETYRALQTRTSDLRETLEYQTATSEVLKVISRSTFDLQPVLDAVVETAARLCNADQATLARSDGKVAWLASNFGFPTEYEAYVRSFGTFPVDEHSPLVAFRALSGRRVVHIHDVAAVPNYPDHPIRLGKQRTSLGVPLLREGEPIGVIVLARQRVEPFTDRQIELVRTFADQAVIAMENARLITETREALEQQTATAEVLQVINASPGNLAPVFDAMLDKGMRLCGAAFGILRRFDGERMHTLATLGVPAAYSEYMVRYVSTPAPGTSIAEALDTGQPTQVLNMLDGAGYSSGQPDARAIADLGGARTVLHVPLVKDRASLGLFTLYRQEVRAFTGRQIVLLKNFAAQAVIAMENARLINEQREALEQQTATAEVLQVINASPGNLTPVFDAILDKAHSLCGATVGNLAIYKDGYFHAVATHGFPEQVASLMLHPNPPNSTTQELIDGARFRQIDDVRAIWINPDYLIMRALVEYTDVRTVLFVPLRKDGAFLGFISVNRPEVRPFSENEIALLESFAAQAVIAMENARLLTEQREALEQQTAVADVLQVINASPGNLGPVFEVILEKAVSLCEASLGVLHRYDGAAMQPLAARGPSRMTEAVLHTPLMVDPGTAVERLLHGESVIHIADITDTETYRSRVPSRVKLVEMTGARTALWVALRKDASLIGTLVIYRTQVRPFSDREIALVENFAAQAVIAMENARLITEQREALERQTATAEVLQVINASPGNLPPVFDALLERALRLCESSFGILCTYDGEFYHTVAMRDAPPGYADLIRAPFRPGPGMSSHGLVLGKNVVHVRDVTADASYDLANPLRRALADQSRARTAIWIALRRDDTLIGMINIYRREVRPYSDQQIALLENFASHAVIAMENARLLSEQQEALEQQTATAEVLQVINASPGNLTPVFDAMLEKAMRLCGAACGGLFTYDGERFHTMATLGVPVAAAEFRIKYPPTAQPGSGIARLLRTRRTDQILDRRAEEDYWSAEPGARAMVELGGARTMLNVPLLKEDEVVGFFSVYRQEVRAFSEKQIALLENFAAQAVIAMENARLLDEIRQRQAELRTTFDNMGDGVAMFDTDLCLLAWNRNFQRIIDLPDTLLETRLRYTDYLRLLAERGEFGTIDIEAELSLRIEDTDKELRLERVRPDGRVIEVRRNAVPGGGFVLIYSDITERKRSEEQIRAARDAAETALRDLRAAQANLIQAEKMASLGQLTAGIAHEIKNPLNFVNNFSALSTEVIDELRDLLAPEPLGETARTEVDDLTTLLKGNLEKVVQHGQRADGIVRSMLDHSRGSSGERRMVDLNAVIDEALNLAYHGARAQDQSFNITLERDFGEGIAPIEVNPQDITRVFLNLFANGFYAVTRRARDGGDAGFVPTLKVTTSDAGEAVEIRVRDNGTGIPADIRDKLFQPFFTTKPTGEGTGLGLSITYDIVTQQHGGSIAVDSKVGEYSEFTIRLPRNP